jgi:hypothetical protein
MNTLVQAKFSTTPQWRFFLRMLGMAFTVVGIIAAIMNGFTPITWLLLAIASFLGVICSALFRMLSILEQKSAR